VSETVYLKLKYAQSLDGQGLLILISITVPPSHSPSAAALGDFSSFNAAFGPRFKP